MNDYVKSLLKGNMFPLTVKCCASKLSCCVFALYCVSSLYLLIFDTSFIADIRLFENKLIAMTVCAVTVIIGFLLLLNALWQRYRYKTGVFSVCERVEIQEFSFSSAIRYLSLRAAVNLLKGIYLSLGMLPSVSVFCVIYMLLKIGTDASLLVVLSLSAMILFLNGTVFFSDMCQKYALADYYFSECKENSIKEIIRFSEAASDGRLKSNSSRKLKRILLRMAGIVIPVFAVREDAYEFVFLTEKIIPHTIKKQHAEKSVVFYFGNEKAG